MHNHLQKILLTGASGFLGRHLLDFNKKNDIIKADDLYLLTSKHIPGYQCVLHNNHIYNEGLLPQIDTVIQLGSFCPKTKLEANDVGKNVGSIASCLYLINHLPNLPKKIIYISTISVYGSRLIDYPFRINEQTEAVPDSIYGHVKLICEKIVKEYCRKYSIDLCILRLGVSYGENDTLRSGTIPTLVKSILKGEELKISNGGNCLKHFVHTSDISRIIWESIKNASGIINIVDDKTISVNQIIRLIEMYSGKRANLTFSKSQSPGNDSLFDNQVMIKNFGSLNIDIFAGLKSICAFYKDSITG